MRFIPLLLLLLCSCDSMPVFQGDYKTNLVEIENKFLEVKEKIADTTGVIVETLNSDPEIAKIVAQKHDESIKEWAKEDVKFSQPVMGDMLAGYLDSIIAMIITLVLGGTVASRKIGAMKQIAIDVAEMNPEDAKKELKKRKVT